MEQIWEDLDSGQIHLRDRWQFELKSEFVPLPFLKKNTYIQEFFFFIPNSLQINKQTYTKANFYADQTNLIRYKTPEFTFSELLDKYNSLSPLTRLYLFNKQIDTKENREHAEDEIKLFGNIVRSALRTRVREIIQELSHSSQLDRSKLIKDVEGLCNDIKNMKSAYRSAKEFLLKNWKDAYLEKSFLYIEEFISNCITHYITGLVDTLRLAQKKSYQSADRLLCEILLEERKFIESHANDLTTTGKNHQSSNEFILYRNGLLNKYVLDSLLLYTTRRSIDELFQDWIGALSAGIAMLFFFILYVWLGNVFMINSTPFIVLTVVLYILKDRIKEWLKSVSYQQAFKFFFDFITQIETPDQKRTLGIIKESFSFLNENKLASDVKNVRNREFHAVLQTFQPPETVLYYKKSIKINEARKQFSPRRQELNVIFRFNIHHFLNKAREPHESYVTIDPNTLKLITMRLPKVYHLNLIIKKTYLQADNKVKIELNKLRLIVDKNGIKRIEQL